MVVVTRRGGRCGSSGGTANWDDSHRHEGETELGGGDGYETGRWREQQAVVTQLSKKLPALMRLEQAQSPAGV